MSDDEGHNPVATAVPMAGARSLKSRHRLYAPRQRRDTASDEVLCIPLCNCTVLSPGIPDLVVMGEQIFALTESAGGLPA